MLSVKPSKLIDLTVDSVISLISGIAAIVIVGLLSEIIIQSKGFESLVYVVLLLVVRWGIVLVWGSLLFSVLVYFFARKPSRFLTLFLLALINALIMVSFRESQTMFRFGVFSWEYLDDIRRNSKLFIPYVFLVPILCISWQKKSVKFISSSREETLDAHLHGKG